MKTKLFSIRTFLLAAALIPAVSCSQDDVVPGTVFFDIDGEMTVSYVTKGGQNVRISDFTELPDKGEFNLSIRNSSNETVWTGLLSEWSVKTVLPAGNYSVEASFGNVSEEGADKPCFAGSKTFTVSGSGTTSVGIPVTLQNCIVKVECTDAFDRYFPEHSFTVTSGDGNVFLFDKSTSKAIFIDAYKLTLTGEMENQSGVVTDFGPKTYEGLSPATCYTIRMDVTNIGNLHIVVTFNDTVETVDLGEMEMNN